MTTEQTARFFLAEPNKQLNYVDNPDLEWRSSGRGGFEIRLPIVSQVSPEFTLLVSVNPKIPRKPSIGIYFEQRTRILGLDLNTDHRNPDHRVVEGSHLHRYTDKDGDAWADPVECPNDLWGAVNRFLEVAKIVEIPVDWQSMPPGIDQLPYQAWNH